MYISIYAYFKKFFFYIDIRLPIKLKKKGHNLIEKFIIYSLRNIKATETVILRILKT